MTDPQHDEGRPCQDGPNVDMVTNASDSIAQQLRRRRAAAWRATRFEDATNRRDPSDLLVRASPRTFGLSLDDRRSHGRELVDRWGWTWTEVGVRLDLHAPEAA